MIYYYVQRGHNWNDIASAPQKVKDFLTASMIIAQEEEAKKYKAMFGKKK
ncbi:MAG: hypothetical protein LUC95_08290 [Lachnospiraceae bacterium]|nr:hypothetical protein [Lachnospiraceae bacterium]